VVGFYCFVVSVGVGFHFCVVDECCVFWVYVVWYPDDGCSGWCVALLVFYSFLVEY